MKSKIIELILKKGSLNHDRLIGVEIEDIIYTNKCNRIPVNQSKEYSASDLLNDLIELKKNKKETYDYSMESLEVKLEIRELYQIKAHNLM